MPDIRIERGATALPSLTRGAVAAGQVFSVMKKDGTLGRKQYAHIGSNGKFYSVNVASKELASTKNPKSAVKLVGKFKYNVETTPGAGRSTTRGEVRDGEIFTVGAEPGALYLNMGRKSTGEHISVNLLSHNIASTSNSRSAVKVVGKGSMAVQVTA